MPFTVLARVGEERLFLILWNDHSYFWNVYGFQYRIVVFGELEAVKGIDYLFICEDAEVIQL